MTNDMPFGRYTLQASVSPIRRRRVFRSMTRSVFVAATSTVETARHKTADYIRCAAAGRLPVIIFPLKSVFTVRLNIPSTANTPVGISIACSKYGDSGKQPLSTVRDQN